MIAIVILSQRLRSWREEFVTFGMSVQRISPKSAKQWNSFSPFGNRWRKRRQLNQNCFWIIDINEQIYLLITLWLFSFYEIIVSQFLVIRWGLTEKENLKSFFDVQIFIFLGYSYQPYATEFSITFSVLHLWTWNLVCSLKYDSRVPSQNFVTFRSQYVKK